MFFDGKRTLITGASKGIGLSVAYKLAEKGCDLVTVARSKDLLEDQAKEMRKSFGIDVLCLNADMTKEEDAKKVLEQTEKQRKDVHILINNIGVGKYGPLGDFSVADYDWIMNSNMRSSFLATHFFLPPMLKRKKGWIYFIGSVAGLKGLPGEALYCASKFAQIGFAQSLDYETRRQGIKVGVIAPGGVHTHFAMGTGRKPDDPLLDQMLHPDDVANALLFALEQSEKSRVFLVGMRPMSEPL